VLRTLRRRREAKRTQARGGHATSQPLKHLKCRELLQVWEKKGELATGDMLRVTEEGCQQKALGFLWDKSLHQQSCI